MISINLEQIFMLQVARDIGGLMDNKSIFKDIGERESNLCQGSPPDPVLSLYAPGWRSNRLCVIKWWWWLYLTFVKGGAPDFSRSVLSASVQWINPQTEWDRVKMLFLGVNTGVILRWMKGMCLQSLCVISSCLSSSMCVRAHILSPCSPSSVEKMSRGQLYLHGDP